MSRKGSWGADEDQIIRDAWAAGSAGALERAMPLLKDRTPFAVRQRHSALKKLDGEITPGLGRELKLVSQAALHDKTERFLRPKAAAPSAIDLGDREYMRTRAIKLVEEIARIIGKPVRDVAEAFVQQAKENFVQDHRLQMSMAIDGPVTMDGMTLR